MEAEANRSTRSGGDRLPRPLRRRRTLGAAALAACAAAALVAGCGSSSNSSPDDASASAGSTTASGGDSSQYTEVSLRLADDFPVQDQPLNVVYQDWATRTIEQQSGGKISVRFFPNAELYDGPGAAHALQNGTLDMAAIATPTLGGVISDFNVLSLPFVGPDLQRTIDLTDPSLPLWRKLADDASAQGMTMLPTGGWVPGNLGVVMKSSTRSSLDALRGEKVRTVGGAVEDSIFQHLGASPINMPPTDVPTAMQTGTLDAAKGSPSFLLGPLNGIAHGYIDTGSMLSTSYLLFASTQRWNALSDADRQLITATLQRAFSDWNRQLPSVNEQSYRDLQSRGMWLTHFTDADIRKYESEMKPVWDDFGTDNAEVYDALKQSRQARGLPPTLP